ncbi:MAG: carbon storage regulator CsrA [Patescibacteria group bacterium]
MLVLSRKKGQVIMIGDNITITIIEVRGNLVKIGIEAPRDVDVNRHEVWTRFQQTSGSGPDEHNREVL